MTIETRQPSFRHPALGYVDALVMYLTLAIRVPVHGVGSQAWFHDHSRQRRTFVIFDQLQTVARPPAHAGRAGPWSQGRVDRRRSSSSAARASNRPAFW